MKASTKVILTFLFLTMGTTLAYAYINPSDKAGLLQGVCTIFLAGWMVKRGHKSETKQ